MCQSEETPANRKQREREEAKVARDAAKASDIAARFAQSSFLKMEPLYLEMQALVAHNSFGQVSEIVREPINKNCIMTQSYLMACSAGGELPFDQKTLVSSWPASGRTSYCARTCSAPSLKLLVAD